MNSIVKTNDDGFGGARRAKRPRQYLKWDDVKGWRDQDELRPPEVLVLMSVCEFLERWSKDSDGRNVRTIKDEQPLPDLETLNKSIPVTEWPVGRDGKTKEPPYKYNVGFTLVDPATGMSFFYSNHTWGACALYNDIVEAVTTMRALRGEQCVPIVKPSQRPRKSKNYGAVMCPHFETIGWKTLGGGGGDALPAQPAPRLAGPVTAPTLPEAAAPTAPATPQSRPAKPPVQLSDYTLAVMGDVKPVTTGEFINDSLDDI